MLVMSNYPKCSLVYTEVTINKKFFYIRTRFSTPTPTPTPTPISGYSTVRLVCLLWEQEVAGSNPATPTIKRVIELIVSYNLFLLPDICPIILETGLFFRSWK